MAVKEYTTCKFNKLEQKGNEIDNYIVRFNNLSTQLQHDHESPLLIERFCKGLNKGTHNDIMNLDIWPKTLNEWQEATRRVVRRCTIQQERTGGWGNWNLSTCATQWKEALNGNNKGRQNKIKDKDQMQVNITQVETNQTKNEEVNFVQLTRLTLEERIKLAKKGGVSAVATLDTSPETATEI